MILHIWHWTSPVSDSWHNGGALLVIAETLAEARDLALEQLANLDNVKDAGWLTTDPDETMTLAYELPPQVWTHADAGCC